MRTGALGEIVEAMHAHWAQADVQEQWAWCSPVGAGAVCVHSDARRQKAGAREAVEQAKQRFLHLVSFM
jgi:hypothetical protein